MTDKHIRTRFAPSPTGYLHIGGLRTAAYAYALAKKNSGDFILRIEDTDKKREVAGSVEDLCKILKVFGITWDEGPEVGGPYAPYTQSERVKSNSYQKAAEKLLADGHAFYCFCEPRSKEEIKEERQFKIEFRDPCRNLSKEQIAEKLASGIKPAIRLKTPDGETISYRDFVLNKETTWKTDVVDDAMLLKSDGFPTYHLAVVVDDTEMKISHVLRGHDWQPSTPIHLLVYKYLGFPVPEIGHLTDILNPDGKGKLSKRNNNVACEQYLNDGYLADAILNFVILLGWAPKDNQDIFTLNSFVESFDPKGFQKSNPRFEISKLDWLNGQHLRKVPENILFFWMKPLFPSNVSEDTIKALIPLVKERITKVRDVVGLTKFIFETPTINKELVNKEFITMAIEAIKLADWNKDSIESNLMKVANDNSYHRGEFFMNLRLVISGQKVTPPLTECMLIMGKDLILTRLQSVLE
ncbi:MAG: hypothetical protein ACD_57C00357G0002 [uncultured bacterium]|nr:MAG: hypothetical protein ACD_57C00357G0002 [uncultured bacterium]